MSLPRGRLKIFLGYAAGVGKTFRMLEEARRLKDEGCDVVVGYFEPHGRLDTIAKMEGLELVPRRRVEYRDCPFEEMDTDAILKRAPALCAVDEFPHTNVPGSPRAKRWEDVVVLLEAGIDVLTTMNIQHLEGLNDQVREISGIEVRETIPDWIVKEADEVVLIDVPPPALINRLARGVVYAPEKAAHALTSFFKEPTLAALREMALRQTAHEVDLRQSAHAARTPGETQERILIHVTDAPATGSLIRRGRRVADYLGAECLALAVLSHADAKDPTREAADRIQEHLAFARRLHVETHLLVAQDVAQTLVEFARRRRVTQILVSNPRSWSRMAFRKPVAMQVVELAKDMQVTVVAERRAPAPEPA
jgi:two-component system sensor histidine kinase KdpD